MKVTRYEIEYDNEPVKVVYITQEEADELRVDNLFVANKFFLRTVKETKEERWLCQTPNAIGVKMGKEYVIKK